MVETNNTKKNNNSVSTLIKLDRSNNSYSGTLTESSVIEATPAYIYITIIPEIRGNIVGYVRDSYGKLIPDNNMFDQIRFSSDGKGFIHFRSGASVNGRFTKFYAGLIEPDGTQHIPFIELDNNDFDNIGDAYPTGLDISIYNLFRKNAGKECKFVCWFI